MYELDIDSIFDFHPPTSRETALVHEDVRRTMKLAAEYVRDCVPASAEKTLAIRHLQMAMMFANSAVAQSADKQS